MGKTYIEKAIHYKVLFTCDYIELYLKTVNICDGHWGN